MSRGLAYMRPVRAVLPNGADKRSDSDSPVPALWVWSLRGTPSGGNICEASCEVGRNGAVGRALRFSRKVQ